MNILVDVLPETVEVGGKSYKINTDFRVCLRTIMACEDAGLTGYEKALVILTNLFPEIPKDIEAAMEKAKWFLDGGEESSAGEQQPQPRVYSFQKDQKFIFAAFRQTHGIDLQMAELHWWVFIALFMDIGSETTFNQLAALRKRVKTGKATKDERETAQALGDVFEIPDTEYRTLEVLEAEEEFMKAWNEYQKQKQET